MDRITTWLGGLDGPVVYAVIGLLVFCEDALFFGFVLPAETAVVLGGVLASQGKVSVALLAVVVVVAAIVGDSVGYEVGRKLGPSILEVRPLRPHRERVGKAQEFMQRRGGWAVFLGRFVAFFRAMMPALAGISRMPYRRFLPFNALGGLVWGVGFVLLGYFAGTAYKTVEREVGTAAAVVLAVVVVATLVVWHLRRRRAERLEESAAEAADRRDGPAADAPAVPDAPRVDGPRG